MIWTTDAVMRLFHVHRFLFQSGRIFAQACEKMRRIYLISRSVELNRWKKKKKEESLVATHMGEWGYIIWGQEVHARYSGVKIVRYNGRLAKFNTPLRASKI